MQDNIMAAEPAANFFGAHELKSKRRGSLNRPPMFPDPAETKHKLRMKLCKKTQDIEEYYHESGHAQAVVRSRHFEVLTLAVIIANAAWLGFDAELNHSDVLTESEPQFIIMENLFCCFFVAEIVLRFLAFRHWAYCAKDGSFLFDLALVALMIFETWLLPIVLSSGGGASNLNTSVLDGCRLLRLARMARMTRLLRAVPEMLVLVKGMVAAVRAVFFNLLLLLLLTYIFCIIFKSMAGATAAGELYFYSIPMAGKTLLVHGTFCDSLSVIVDVLVEDADNGAFYLLFMFVVYVLLSALTLMNMLVGVLCEVISDVAKTEIEMATIQKVKEQIDAIVDVRGATDDMVRESDFKDLIESDQAAQILSGVGVDVADLVDVAEDLLDAEEKARRVQGRVSSDHQERAAPYEKVVAAVLDLRTSNPASLRDIFELKKYFRTHIQSLESTVVAAVHEDLVEAMHRTTGLLSARLTEVSEASKSASKEALNDCAAPVTVGSVQAANCVHAKPAAREEMEIAETARPFSVEAMATSLPPGPRICILGGTKFQDPATEALVTAIAERLSANLAGRAVVLTGGMPGVQAAFAKAFGPSPSLVHLLPQGQRSDFGVGRDISCGATLEERMEAFGQLGQVYLSFEGGPGVAKEARAAFERGAFVLPLICTGGASGGMFDFPQGALEKPAHATDAQWASLSGKGGACKPEVAAKVVADLVVGAVAGALRDQNGNKAVKLPGMQLCL